MLKNLTLAALTATFVAGSAAVANAEISGGGSPPGPTTERGLQSDYRRDGGAAYSYGYTPQSRVHRSHRVKRNYSTKR
jgi:hypothetical protein